MSHAASLVSAVMLVLAPLAGAAQATPILYDFEWRSSAASSRDVLVNRVNPDGSVTPYDTLRASGELRGAGTLALETTGGYAFSFSGTGGSGAGRAGVDGAIAPGDVTFPVAAVPGLFAAPAGFAGGFLDVDGDPARPDTVRISYNEGLRSNTLCDPGCWSVGFLGLARRAGGRPPATEAAEPLAAVGVVAIGLAAALRSGRAAAARRDAACTPRNPRAPATTPR